MGNIPTNREPSSKLPDFGDVDVRRRLGPSALDLFRRIMIAWNVSDEQSRQLLALEPETGFPDLVPGRLSENQLLRISYVIGIYKALHIVHSEQLADQWVLLPNANAIFNGQPPLAYMIRGGINGLQKVRRLLEARCVGGG